MFGGLIMQNNKLRFKMYKSGKNWMVAGLMTTAVLAGLTLSNGDVVAHADTAAAATTTTQVANGKIAKKNTKLNRIRLLLTKLTLTTPKRRLTMLKRQLTTLRMLTKMQLR